MERLPPRLVGPTTLGLLAVLACGWNSAAASGMIMLANSTSPPIGQAGVTSINVIGSNFPDGTINPSQVLVTGVPSAPSGESKFMAAPFAIKTLTGSTRRITFMIPAGSNVSAAVAYSISIAGRTTAGVSFSSGNSATLTVNPAAQLSAVSPNVASAGQTLTATIKGRYTNFTQGSTIASFGTGIAVGGAAPGGFGLVTVVDSTTLTAQITVAASAVIGSRTLTIQTGLQNASLINGFAVGGRSLVSVPNVVGLKQAAATASITGAGLVVGTVTTSSSNTVPAGSVISQNPAAGTSVHPGSVVNLAVSKGSGTNLPTSINVVLNQFLVTAGVPLKFTDVALDRNGNPVSATPSCQITPDPASSTGTRPVISGQMLDTATDTRGVYSLTCSMTAPTLTASAMFAVLPPTSSGVSTTEQATFATFSETITNTSVLLQQIGAALNARDNSAVDTALKQMQANLDAVDFDALDRSMALAPEGGFVPDTSQLPGFGINPTPQDAALSTNLTNLTTAVQSVTSFLNTTSLATLTSSELATYKQLSGVLTTLVAELSSLNPSAYGIVANVDQEDALFADVLPQFYQALVKATVQYLTANGFTAASARPRKGTLFATRGRDSFRLVDASFYPAKLQPHRTTPHALGVRKHLGVAFQFSLPDIVLASQVLSDSINQTFNGYYAYLLRAEYVLVLHGALQAWTGSLPLDGIISGAFQSLFVFNFAGAVIEGDNLNEIPSNNKVYIIGPDQLNVAPSAYNYLTDLHAPKNNDDLFKEIQGLVDLFKNAMQMYNEANQPPDAVSTVCLIGNSPPCIQLVYNSGFRSVYQPPKGIQFPAPVLIFAINKPKGSWSSGVFNFIPQ